MDFSTLLKAADAFLLPPKMLLLLMGKRRNGQTYQKSSQSRNSTRHLLTHIHSLFHNSQGLEATQMSGEINREVAGVCVCMCAYYTAFKKKRTLSHMLQHEWT